MAANPHRGDVTISLKHKGKTADYVLRPTWQAMAEIEQATGQGFITLLRKAATGGMGLSETAAVVTAGLRASGEAGAKGTTVAAMIFETGIANVIAAINPFLINAMNGGEPPGEAKAADEN